MENAVWKGNLSSVYNKLANILSKFEISCEPDV